MFYALYGIKPRQISSFEETICSAMSLIVLKEFFPDHLEYWISYVRNLENPDYQNGVVIAPGESYSHLKVVHPEGVENIYVDSTIFVGNGKTAQASGGGICQTSSTTYAAIASAEEKGIKTGLNVTAQAPHSGKVNYVPRKYEATVSSGSQDFCFRNCNNYSIKIVTSYNYNTLTVTIYKV